MGMAKRHDSETVKIRRSDLDLTRHEGEIVFAADGVKLIRFADGTRELRISDQALDSMESTFDAIVLAIYGLARPKPDAK